MTLSPCRDSDGPENTANIVKALVCVKTRSFWMSEAKRFHALQSYRNVGITLELNIFTLVRRVMTEQRLFALRAPKACLFFFIWLLISYFDPSFENIKTSNNLKTVCDQIFCRMNYQAPRKYHFYLDSPATKFVHRLRSQYTLIYVRIIYHLDYHRLRRQFRNT